MEFWPRCRVGRQSSRRHVRWAPAARSQGVCQENLRNGSAGRCEGRDVAAKGRRRSSAISRRPIITSRPLHNPRQEPYPWMSLCKSAQAIANRVFPDADPSHVASRLSSRRVRWRASPLLPSIASALRKAKSMLPRSAVGRHLVTESGSLARLATTGSCLALFLRPRCVETTVWEASSQGRPSRGSPNP